MEELLKLENISKKFGNNRVLNRINFDLKAGEIHALLGENGAGKSTLIKILGGIYQPDEGNIILNGEKCSFQSSLDAQKKGISIIHQELMLMPHLSIAENIFIGKELTNHLGLLEKKEQEIQAQKLLKDFDLDFDSSTKLEALTIAQQQMIEIIRAVSFNAKVIAMDEPTSSLSEHEAEKLYQLIYALKEKNVGVILISHRLNDIFQLADRVTVLRDGVCSGTEMVKDTNADKLIQLMVGHAVEQYYAKSIERHVSDEIVMSVEHISDGNLSKDVSFELHKGEILGISGLVGAGRSETMQAIFGISKRKNGKVILKGKEVFFNSPQEAINQGISYVCEDRKKAGLFLKQSVQFNTTINILSKIFSFLKLDKKKEEKIASSFANKLETKITSLAQKTGNLSGGNQQKVLISRWIACDSDVLILDEPTRGVDVKTKQDIYYLMNTLTEDGKSIIFISSELTELLNVCDRIMVMSNGKTTGILNPDEYSQEAVMKLATLEFQK